MSNAAFQLRVVSRLRGLLAALAVALVATGAMVSAAVAEPAHSNLVLGGSFGTYGEPTTGPEHQTKENK
jgi:hypothetical protein